ncbi:FAD-dependent oxidoreductase [Seohaeicola saemankumensis]|uniref:FAD-dependent oxidoreductase n=1 Tax=Seohaeicola saemankumensis TaxID=481181 RepID=UPI0035CFEA93
MADAYDLVVVGSGAAGMSAALTAHHLGLSVVIVEKTEWIGGSTAYSGGATWIPNNPHQVAAGAIEPAGEALTYLQAEVGNHGQPEMWKAFLSAGPEMVRFMEAKTHLKFSMRPVAPDYHPDQPGGALGYRVLDPLDFDARVLGEKLALIRPPIKEFTVFGGMMVGRRDIPHMFTMLRKPSSALHAAKILARHTKDRLTWGRATRLVLGSAMVGRLAHSVFEAGIEVLTKTAAEELIVENGRVIGLKVTSPDGLRTISARRGVVLAGGGAARAKVLDDVLHPHGAHWSMSPDGSTGDSLALVASLGVKPSEGFAAPLFYAPVSLLPQADGSVRPFPHLFLDRAKPGVYAVDGTGHRFVNEAASYHDFVRAMLGHGPGRKPEGQIWLLADHATIRRYGLGAVRPFPAPMGGHLRSGYLLRASTLAELAAVIDVPQASLADTTSRVNGFAITGEDKDYGKGSTAYNRYLGDPNMKPNPCLGSLAKRPFYAIRLFPGDIGASVGLPIDPQARVVTSEGNPISGLFACGNDAGSIMGGTYPGAGITLGPALTFGYIAAHSAAGQRWAGP